MSELLRVEKLSSSRRKKQLLFELDFYLPDNSLTLLLGKNGAGKTTLLQSLVGEPLVSGGSLFFKNEKFNAQDPKMVSRWISYVPQEKIFDRGSRTYDFLTLAFLPKLGLFRKMNRKMEDDLQEMAKALRVDDFLDRHLGEVSQGELQRILLARALLQDPKLLLLDEPTSNLDPAATRMFWEELQRQKEKKGFSVLASTHDLSLLHSTANWVIALEKGRVVYCGDPLTFQKNNGVETLYAS